MSQVNEETLKVMAAAQRFVKSGDLAVLQEFNLETLKMADYQLGGRDVNDGWRKAIQDLIKEREAIPEIVEIKPEVCGVKVNINALLRRAKLWLRG